MSRRQMLAHALGLSVVVILAAVCAGPVAAQEDGLKRIVQRGHINLGYREDAPPFSFLDARRQPVGYSVELCQAMAEQIRQDSGNARLQARWVPVAADQLERVVGSGGVDLMCAGTSSTAARRARMAFSPPIFVSSVRLMVMARDKPASARELKGKTVVVLGRTTAEPAVKAFSDREGLGLRFSRVINADAALAQLQLGQSAAFARDDVLLLDMQAAQAQPDTLALLPEQLSTEIIAIAMPRGNDALQRAADQTVARLVRSGELEQLYEKWFVKPHAGSRAGLNLPMPAELKVAFDKLR